MKKLLLVGAVALFGAMNAQALKVGAHVGLPIGDFADSSSFNVGADVAFVYNVMDNLELGVTTGYSHFVGKEYSTPSFSYMGISVPGTTVKSDLGIVPVAATATYNLTEKFNLGADLGYAFYVGDNVDGGGMYFFPKVGYNLTENDNVFAGFKGISDDGTSGTVSLGYTHKFSF